MEKNTTKDSFIFYRSFYEAISSLPDEERLSIYDAICTLALNQKDTELSGISECLFTLIRPQIIANTKKWKAGTTGGRPKKKTNGYENKKPVVTENKKPVVTENKTNGFENKKPNEECIMKNVNEECIMKNVNEEGIDDTNAYEAIRSDTKNTDKDKDKDKDINYIFSGNIIKLSEKDFNAWKRAYKYIDLNTWLSTYDSFLQSISKDKQKKWFFMTANYLAKKNEEFKPEEISPAYIEEQKDLQRRREVLKAKRAAMEEETLKLVRGER